MGEKSKKTKDKSHKCRCIYCGIEFYSCKANAKYDRNSCRIIYFKEKKAFNAAYEYEAMGMLYSKILPFSKKLLKHMKQVAGERVGSSELDKLLKIVADGTEYVKAKAIKGNLFELYMKEKLESHSVEFKTSEQNARS